MKVKSEKNAQDKKEEGKWIGKFEETAREAEDNAEQIAQFLIQRSIKGGGANSVGSVNNTSGGSRVGRNKGASNTTGVEAEYKEILETVVQDAIETAELVDWPVSALFLRTVVVQVMAIINGGQHHSNKYNDMIPTSAVTLSGVDVGIKGVCIELLSQISSFILVLESKKVPKPVISRKEFILHVRMLQKMKMRHETRASAVYFYATHWIIELERAKNDRRDLLKDKNEATKGSRKGKKGSQKATKSVHSMKKRRAKGGDQGEGGEGGVEQDKCDKNKGIKQDELNEVEQTKEVEKIEEVEIQKWINFAIYGTNEDGPGGIDIDIDDVDNTNNGNLTGMDDVGSIETKNYGLEVGKGCDDNEGTENINKQMELLATDFGPMLKLLISNLDSPIVAIRTKTIKGIGLVIAKKPNLLQKKSRSKLKKAIAMRLKDNSPLVREATVDLVGKYLLQAERNRLLHVGSVGKGKNNEESSDEMSDETEQNTILEQFFQATLTPNRPGQSGPPGLGAEFNMGMAIGTNELEEYKRTVAMLVFGAFEEYTEFDVAREVEDAYENSRASVVQKENKETQVKTETMIMKSIKLRVRRRQRRALELVLVLSKICEKQVGAIAALLPIVVVGNNSTKLKKERKGQELGSGLENEGREHNSTRNNTKDILQRNQKHE
ncbi:Protein rad9 [Zancudomyces culisetae]|uniref:Protein rad9 n=1 Tax=Zancudomyces culisetae TaxID=1213189 RepID=A0A1R1PSG4_ZANCU|nr:Protein rad9 [Zancudomyces culisetae]|eukprot:OMH83910.1 Protein rad9 [Zancudomyces culisetae]